ncbi:MAG: hypothetical protein AAGA53_17500 [Pseudomonadota bacterium]
MTLSDFTYAKAIAHFDGKWRTCMHNECRKREVCTGGPRGTNRKTKGVPLCELNTKDTADAELSPKEAEEVMDRLEEFYEEPSKHKYVRPRPSSLQEAADHPPFR